MNTELKEFLTYFDFNTESPTCFYFKGTKHPAGYKQRTAGGYVWVISHRVTGPEGKRNKNKVCQLTKLIYEVTRETTVKRQAQSVAHIDGNRDNLHPDNLRLIRNSLIVKHIEKIKAYDSYRNVILSKTNPDYFKDPADWTNPDALKALAQEKLDRERGVSLSPCDLGAKVIWK